MRLLMQVHDLRHKVMKHERVLKLSSIVMTSPDFGWFSVVNDERVAVIPIKMVVYV